MDNLNRRVPEDPQKININQSGIVNISSVPKYPKFI